MLLLEFCNYIDLWHLLTLVYLHSCFVYPVFLIFPVSLLNCFEFRVFPLVFLYPCILHSYYPNSTNYANTILLFYKKMKIFFSLPGRDLQQITP